MTASKSGDEAAELRRGLLDVGAAPAAVGQRAGPVTSADDGQQTRERTPAPWMASETQKT
ncbi:hypothetical protein Scep_027696 [Stephania cephalantha]|uniref:Uncharacterized protein n=1 Tax=Stephania cephalantha TaxID=152367 RepID=A0AAP0EGW0_9MAGN